MMRLQALVALDLARERSREAARLADLHRVIDLVEERVSGHPTASGRPGPLRRAAAALLHRVEGGASTVARVAREAARRLDGSTA